jgi:hypothetical protein
MVCSTLSARCVGVHICRMSIDAHMYAFMESKSQVLWGRKQWGEGRLLYGRRDVLCLSCPQYNVHACTCVPCMCACAYRQIQRWIRCTYTKNTHCTHGQVPWRASTKQGAMLIMLHMDHKGPFTCDHHCVDTLGMTATFGVKFLKSTRVVISCSTCAWHWLFGNLCRACGVLLFQADCQYCADGCALSVPLRQIAELERNGKGHTGGLGKRMVKRADKEYGVWACLRDWSPEEQIACGARNRELACFYFDEKKSQFDFKGLNHTTHLVTPAAYERGLSVEDHMLRGHTLDTLTRRMWDSPSLPSSAKAGQIRKTARYPGSVKFKRQFKAMP